MTLADHQQSARAFSTAFPDLPHTVEQVVAVEDRVAVRFVIRGTHRAAFLGIPTTCNPIQISAVVTCRVADGRVSGLRGVFDQMSLMRQLGVVPA
jgi:predicted ester cyclase